MNAARFSCRAPLTTIGWVLEPSDTGTRYYTKRFTISPETPTDVANAVDLTNRTMYGDRAKDGRWAVKVRPQYLAGES